MRVVEISVRLLGGKLRGPGQSKKPKSIDTDICIGNCAVLEDETTETTDHHYTTTKTQTKPVPIFMTDTTCV